MNKQHRFYLMGLWLGFVIGLVLGLIAGENKIKL